MTTQPTQPTPLLRRVTPAQATRTPRVPVDAPTLDTARAMLDEIDRDGDAAVLRFAQRLGDLRDNQPILLGPADLRLALDALPFAQRDLLERTADRIDRFARAQRACLTDLSIPIPGGHAGHTCIPVACAGCYAPGGRFPLPSSVLMTAVTARAAGVPQVWVASPRPAPATIAAAAVAKADGLLTLGGVQAVAALAKGLLGLPRCDIIVGPGNRWVTAAKHLLSTQVGIDMLAGPSELVVLADPAADPALIAADLLAQAEHDDDASPILVTSSSPLIDDVESQLRQQLPRLSTRATAEAALRNSMAVLTPDLDSSIAVCNAFAPEHLEILTDNPASIASRIQNAGAIFLGPQSPEVLGDYGAGPNHVLPTGGSARSRAGLSVFNFLRPRTWLRIDDPAGAQPLLADARDLARLESLDAHARSAQLRLV